MLSYDEGIIIGPTDGEVIDTILGNVDGITLGLNIGTDLGFLDVSFDGSYDRKPEGLFIEDLLGSTDGKVLDTIIGNAYGITLGIDVERELGSLDGSFNCYNGSKPEGLFLRDSLGSTDGKVIVSDEGIKLVTTDSKVLGTLLENVDGITLRLDVGTELGYLDGPFDGSNDGKLEGLLIGESLGSTDGKVIGSDEGIKLGLFDSEVIGTIIGNIDGITLGIDV